MCIILIFIIQLFNTAEVKAIDTSLQIIGKDTFYIGTITPVYIYIPKVFTDEEKREYLRYKRLVYNVKKVYPYAKIAAQVYKEVNDSALNILSKKDRNEYIKKVENELRAKYENELKRLTITQGKILIKLFYRETQNTTYQAVKELRGSFEAFFWQTLARMFGSSLKTKYEPLGEDREIEEIVKLIEMGTL